MIPAAAITQFTPDAIWLRYGETFIAGAFNVLFALFILIAGLWITGWLAAAVRRLSRRSARIDNTLAAFFASIVRYTLMAFVVVAVLDQFGVQTTQIIAVLGAATLAIGLSLQGTLSNVAAGVMLILFRPYRLGDFVELAGKRGKVCDVNIFVTELSTQDNVKVVLPNGQCWGAPILNFTANGTRMLEMTFNVAYDTNLDIALALLLKTATADARVMKDPTVAVNVTALNDFSVALLLRAWCQATDYLPLRLDTTKAVKEAFDAAGIAFPFPTTVTYQHDVRAT